MRGVMVPSHHIWQHWCEMMHGRKYSFVAMNVMGGGVYQSGWLIVVYFVVSLYRRVVKSSCCRLDYDNKNFGIASPLTETTRIPSIFCRKRQQKEPIRTNHHPHINRPIPGNAWWWWCHPTTYDNTGARWCTVGNTVLPRWMWWEVERIGLDGRFWFWRRRWGWMEMRLDKGMLWECLKSKLSIPGTKT